MILQDSETVFFGRNFQLIYQWFTFVASVFAFSLLYINRAIVFNYYLYMEREKDKLKEIMTIVVKKKVYKLKIKLNCY